MNEREKIIRLWFDMWIKKAPPQLPISQFQKLEFEQKPKGLMSPMLFSFLLLFQFKHSQFVRFFFLTAPHFTLLFILFLL